MSYAWAELPDEASLKDSAATARRASRTYASRSGGLVVNGKRATSIGPGAAATVSGERALVISDIDATPTVAAAVKRLEKAGFAIVGNHPGSTAVPPPGEREAEIQLEAEARRVRDMGSLEDADVSKRLSGWLGESGELSLLVWFAKGGEEGTPHFFVIMPPGNQHQALFRTGMEALAGSVN